MSRPAARLILSESVLQQLRQRVAAGDPAWTQLKKRCDDYTTGTVYPPNGNAYPDYPNVGQGYQGEEYLPVIRALGLCYRTVTGIDAAAQARYATAGSRVLEAMSTPVGAGGQSPSTDSGYGIRNYGVGMAFGYDWLYPALSASTKSRVVSSLNTWIDWYDQSGFINNDPIGNYFAGYFLAKVTAALATEGENPKATTYWNDVVTRMWGTLVKPHFTSMMGGGGWPEGWGYGKKAVLSFAEALWAVKSAIGLDWWSEVPLAADQARYVMHFAWPSLKHIDDQGTIRSGTNLRPSTELLLGLAAVLDAKGDAFGEVARGFAADGVTAAGDDSAPWSKFLYGHAGKTAASYKSESLSHFASGPGHVGMRSSWETNAVWGALSGGPYINADYSGEQLFNAGGISVVVGDQPILINPTGWLPQNAGTAGERTWSTTTATAPGSAGSTTRSSSMMRRTPTIPAKTASRRRSPKHTSSASRTAAGFVRARAMGLEDQYGRSGSRPVTQFTRDLVYVRPGTFVLFDRTGVAQAGADQWLSFHTPVAATQTSTTDGTQRRFDVTVNGALTGSIRTLLPRSATTTTASLPAGAMRLEVHAPVRAAAQQWLSVVTAGTSAANAVRLSAADGNMASGNMIGVELEGARKPGRAFRERPGSHGKRYQRAVQRAAGERRPRPGRRRAFERGLRGQCHALGRKTADPGQRGRTAPGVSEQDVELQCQRRGRGVSRNAATLITPAADLSAADLATADLAAADLAAADLSAADLATAPNCETELLPTLAATADAPHQSDCLVYSRRERLHRSAGREPFEFVLPEQRQGHRVQGQRRALHVFARLHDEGRGSVRRVEYSGGSPGRLGQPRSHLRKLDERKRADREFSAHALELRRAELRLD